MAKRTVGKEITQGLGSNGGVRVTGATAFNPLMDVGKANSGGLEVHGETLQQSLSIGKTKGNAIPAGAASRTARIPT